MFYGWRYAVGLGSRLINGRILRESHHNFVSCKNRSVGSSRVAGGISPAGGHNAMDIPLFAPAKCSDAHLNG